MVDVLAKEIDISIACRALGRSAEADLLINLWTGAKPTKRAVEMMAFYLMGVASEDEVMRHSEAEKNERLTRRADAQTLWRGC